MASKEEKKEEGEGGKEGESKPKGGKKKLIIIIAAVVVLLGGGGGAFMAMSGGGAAEGEKHEEEKPPELKTAELGQFIVNLSDAASFLKVTILLEYDQTILEKAAHHGEEGGGGHGGGGSGGGGEAAPGGLPGPIKEREPIIKDAVIRVLSSKKAADVLNQQGKETLKEELLEAINEAIGLDDSPVTNIYFSEFIVQ